MWYTVSVLFRAIRGGQERDDDRWEERILLTEATSETEAEERVKGIARAAEHEYVTALGENLRWTFVHLGGVCAVDAERLEHGTELFSRFLGNAEVTGLLTPFED